MLFLMTLFAILHQINVDFHHELLSATNLKQIYFNDNPIGRCESLERTRIPPAVFDSLETNPTRVRLNLLMYALIFS